MTDQHRSLPPYSRSLATRRLSLPSRLEPSGAAVHAPTEHSGLDANRVYPIRYAYQWTDTTTGEKRTVPAISRDDAYESVAGIRRIQQRHHRRPDAVLLSGLGDGQWLDGDITPRMATGVDTVSDIDIVAQICREVLQDIADGVLPASISRFSELHDHVDANTYADEQIVTRQQLSGQDFIDFIGQVQDVVTGWLQAGRPPTFAVTPPIGPIIVQLHSPTTYPDTPRMLSHQHRRGISATTAVPSAPRRATQHDGAGPPGNRCRDPRGRGHHHLSPHSRRSAMARRHIQSQRH